MKISPTTLITGMAIAIAAMVYAASPDTKGWDSDTLKQINSNINNSRNPICVLEQLEDIKSALNQR
jgi:hypothetical protein